MSNQTVENDSATVAVWSTFNPIDFAEMKIFNEAVGHNHVIGIAVYTVEAVAIHRVTGTNYKFRCTVEPIYKLEPLQWHAIVEIFNPVSGKPRVVHVKPY